MALAVPTPILDLGTAAALGLLLGLQRERTHSRLGVEGTAGARTFPLTALLGGLAGLAGGVARPKVPLAAPARNVSAAPAPVTQKMRIPSAIPRICFIESPFD